MRYSEFKRATKRFSSVLGMLAVFATSCGSEDASETGDHGISGPSAGAGASAGFGASGDGKTSMEDGVCAATTAQTSKGSKVDIIFVIDNSGSMLDEIVQIRENINRFASRILNRGLDLRVIFITDKFTKERNNPISLCVPPPLAKANCADNLPTFVHLSRMVKSTDSLRIILDSYENPKYEWKNMHASTRTKVFIVVTDDESDMSSGEFERALLAVQPSGMFGTKEARKYVFHSIVSKPSGAEIPTSDVCPTAEGSSLEYQLLSQQTGGIVEEVCKTDYSSVLDNIAKDVVVKLGCELSYPKTEEPNPSKVAVKLTRPGSPAQSLTRVSDASKCGQVQDGWYYDDNTSPTKIILCPTTCNTANEAANAKLEALVGCEAPAPR